MSSSKPTAAQASARRAVGASAPKSPVWSNWTVIVVVVVVFAVVVGVAVALSGRGEDAAAAGGTQVVRDDSRVLQAADDEGAVTFVEFLDFECEACGAAYPFVEQLREEYAGRVEFVLRYFPGTGHFNAENAAVAVEAAAQQGYLEQMYSRMYETQTEWGEGQTSEAERFRGYAQDLGLDMQAYDAAVADPATLDRVLSDRADGIDLGVQGTPTFFIDGARQDPTSYQDLADALDAALADQQ